MSWQIVMQEEKVGKVSVPVKCKNVRMFPVEQGGQVVGFGRLNFVLLQIIIRRGSDERKLKVSTYRGIDDPKFVVQFPDTMEYPKFYTGKGKNRREWYDGMAKPVKKPGQKDEYDTLPAFESYLKRVVGEEMANEIIGLFLSKMTEVLSKKAA